MNLSDGAGGVSIDQLINYLSTLVLSGVAVWNIATTRKRNESLKNVDDVTNIKALNESVTLANERALQAERLYNTEKQHFEDEREAYETKRQEQDEKIFLLTQRQRTLEIELVQKQALPYRITFDVVFGADPLIQSAIIRHLPERRIEEKEVEIERRKGV